MFFLWLFLCFTKCETKYLCFTTGPVSNYRCSNENTVTEVTNETDFTSLITSRIKSTDKDIYIYLSGPIEFEFPFNIFNNKNLTVQFTDSGASGLFDVIDIANIDINLIFLSQRNSNPIVTLEGTSFVQPQSTFKLQNIDLNADFTDFQVKSFTSIHSTFSMLQINTNSFVYHVNSDIELKLNDKKAVIGDKTIEFSNDNPNLNITFEPSHEIVITNEATESSSLPKISISNANSITLKGNTYSESNSISLINCPLIIANVNYLPLSSLEFTDYTQMFKLIVSNSITIKDISLVRRQNLTIDVANKPPTSRISVNVKSVSLKEGFVQLLSSWIDFVVDEFEFESTILPISPCLGSGGSSTFIAKEASIESESKLIEINPIFIQLDIKGPQTDQTLSKLISQTWETIKIESFSKSVKNEAISSFYFTPSDINGFGSTKETRIIEATANLNTDLTITIKASSLNTIPLLICYTDSSSCSGGIAINNLTKLTEIIPADQKAVNLTIGKEGGEIDLTELKTKDATFSIVQATKSSATVSSITMDEDTPNTKISRLILESIHFGTGLFYFNANEITFTMCRTTELPNISFNEEGVLYIDDYSFDQLRTRIDGIYPMTNFVTIIDQRYSSLEITDSKYLFKDSYTERDFPFDQIPKVVFNIGMESNNDYEFQYKVSTPIIDSVTLKFASHQLYQDKFNPKITINMNNFDVIEKANKIEIDIDEGLNSGNVINLNHVPKHNYFTFNGENLVIKNAGAKKENNFCVCKSVPCADDFCESDMNEISYSELNSKIQSVSDDILKATIVGDKDGSSPILSLSSINNKNAKFIGVGTNPTITIDLETQYESPNNKIEFSNIKIDHTEGQSLQISNLVLNEDCTIDASFKSIPFTTDYIQCFVSHLVFSTLNVKKSMELKGDATNSQSSTKVTFASSSIFSYALPSKVTIRQASLVFNNLEFDLANSLPNLSIDSELTDFTINGENGNLDSISSDLIINQTSNLKTVYVKGTWTNNNPTKFITLNKFSSNLYLDSDNIPLNIIYLTNEKIVLERPLVNIIGKLTFKGSYSGNYELSASSTISGRSTLKVNHAHISSGITNFQFATSDLDFVIGTYTSESISPKFKFFLLIDLDGSNSLSITNPYRNDIEFTYDIHCTINEKLSDPRMVNFINKNHSLITVNKENTIKKADDITFDSDATIGFNNKNFKLAVINGNNLIFYTNKSPLVSSVDFYYGDCSSCTGTQLKTEDLSIIDQLIPMNDAEITITFYDSLEDKNKFIDLNKQSLKIHSLTLKSYFSAVKKNVNIILGHSVDYLFLNCITLNNVDEDSISLKKATLRKGSSFSKNANLADVECIDLDQDSIFNAMFTEFDNELIMNIDSSTYVTLNYTKTGMKIIKDFNSEITVFDIDVSKIPNVNLLVNSQKTPKINLEKDASELHQIKSLVFDSSTFVIGSNWDKMDESSSKVKYSFNTKQTDVTVITDSFPFYSWNLMYEYTIQFSDAIAPFTLNDEFTLHNENISLSTYIPTHHKYSDIVFKELKLSGSSSIQHAEETSTRKLIINELEVDEDSSVNVVNALVKDSLKIEEGGVVQGDFEIDPYIIEIEIEWSLNHLPLLNPSILQSIYPTALKIIYKGSSIDDHEGEFDNLLINGLTIMKNVSLTSKLLSKVKFESDDEEAFKDGDKLALKLIQDSETNEVKIALTHPLSDQTTLPPSIEPTKVPPKPTSEPSQDDSYKPTVDDSYNLNGSKMVFLQNGYMDDNNEISIENNQNEILIVHAKSNQVSLSTETSAHPKKNIYLSPTNKNTEIIIERSNNYGLGEFGIHANSQNPIVKVPTTNVPLNLYNDVESEVTFEVDDQTPFKNSMSLKKLTLNEGNLRIQLPASMSIVNFDSIETYQSSAYDSFNGNEVVESIINKMTVKKGSTISLEKARFANLISMGENTQIEVKKVASFDDETVIELTKSSFIELGSSEIKGVCRQISLVENEKLLGQDEVNIQLICGLNFNCSAWKSKFVGDQIFTRAKCTVNKNREMCLVMTDAKEDEDGNGGDSGKKKFSVFLICGIAVGAVGVILIAATFIYRCVKNRKPATKGYVSHSNTNNPNIDEILVNDGNLDL